MILKILTSNPTIILVICSLVFGGGWTVRGWYEDSIDYTIQQTALKMADIQDKKESEIVKTVEEKLKKLKANERIIEKQLQPII